MSDRAWKVPRHPEAFSLDRTAKRRDERGKDAKHLAFVRLLSCAVCGSGNTVEAAHVRYRDPAHRKPGTAMAQKPADRWAVPLCRRHHRDGPESQHGGNERAWWESHGIDPLALAVDLYAVSGELAAGHLAVTKARGSRK